MTTWTKGYPKVYGYYWLRGTRSRFTDELYSPAVVEVDELGVWFFGSEEPDGIPDFETDWNKEAEWWGPLEMPE